MAGAQAVLGAVALLIAAVALILALTTVALLKARWTPPLAHAVATLEPHHSAAARRRPQPRRRGRHRVTTEAQDSTSRGQGAGPMACIPWIGLAALVGMFVIPHLPS
jgi:hypothetical protein